MGLENGFNLFLPLSFQAFLQYKNSKRSVDIKINPYSIRNQGFFFYLHPVIAVSFIYNPYIYTH